MTSRRVPPQWCPRVSHPDNDMRRVVYGVGPTGTLGHTVGTPSAGTDEPIHNALAEAYNRGWENGQDAAVDTGAPDRRPDLWRAAGEDAHGGEWCGRWRVQRAVAERQARRWREQDERDERRFWIERCANGWIERVEAF